MKILLVNDDGIAAPGLAALRSAVQDRGEVTVVAPQQQHSGMGHAITIHPAAPPQADGARPYPQRYAS